MNNKTEQLTDLWIEQPLVENVRAKVPPDVQVHQAELGTASPYANAATAQAAIAVTQIRYDTAFMDAAPNLQIISRAGIGLDNVDVAEATRRRIAVCNAPDGPTESTAEHAVAMMLALAKKLKPADANMAEGKFGPRGPLLGNELCGKTLGLVGLGRIGRRVAEICHFGLRMHVIGCDPAVDAPAAQKMGVELKSREEVIEQSDVLSLHVPLVPETKQMINCESLARMRRGVYLINVSRGALINEADLLEALVSGQVTGAGLDVFDPEPPPENSPLRHHPNIIVTPHVASVTIEGRARTDEMALQSVLDFFAGRRPKNLVNRQVWR